MPTLECARCGPIVVPDDLTPELRRQVGETVHGGSPLAAVKVLRDHAPMTLKEAKALVIHLVRRDGHCQRCDAALELSELARSHDAKPSPSPGNRQRQSGNRRLRPVSEVSRDF